MKKTIPLNSLIFEKIKFRYDFYDINRVYDRLKQNKLLLDTFYPYILAREIAYPNDGVLRLTAPAQRGGYAISDRVATDLSCRKLHISELVTMLGYTKTDISKLLQGVKNKQYNLSLVGLGGTGSNFLHWAYEMSSWTGKDRIFDKLSAYDDDDFDIPNMLRIPFIPEFRTNQQSSKKIDCIPGKFKELAMQFIVFSTRMTEGSLTVQGMGRQNKTIIYGAPDIQTRSWLSASAYTFIAATHRDSEFSLVENPSVDDELMMETYGKINVSKFMLNHLTMTIKFLEHLRDRTDMIGSADERDIIREDFDQLYSSQLIAGFKAGAKRLFVHSGTTEALDLPQEVV